MYEPRSTCLIFASGKVVCTGAQTEQLACMASIKAVMLLQGSGMPELWFRNFQVENIVSAVHCPFQLDLYRLAESVSGSCSYEPALFPGLVYRTMLVPTDRGADAHVSLPCKRQRGPESGGSAPRGKRREIVFICFQSGKCVITGGNDCTEILFAWRRFFTEILSSYKAIVNYGSSGNYRVCEQMQRPGHTDALHRLATNSVAVKVPEILQTLSMSAPDDCGMLDCEDQDFREQLQRAWILSDMQELRPPDSMPDADTTRAIRLVTHLRQTDSLGALELLAPELRRAVALRARVMCEPGCEPASHKFEPVHGTESNGAAYKRKPQSH